MKGKKRLLVAALLVIAAVLLALGIIDVGCDRPVTVTTVAGSAIAFSTVPPAAPDPPPRRPTRRYFFGRTEDRCDVYSVDGAATSAPESFPCPEDLRAGERIRIAGKTCTLESPDPARREPVVCPDPLTNLEKRDLARDHPPPP